jgi:HK97 family phage major capsid protein
MREIDRDEIALTAVEVNARVAAEAKRAADALESTKTPAQRKVELMRKVRETYERHGLDYEAEQAKRRYQEGRDQQGMGAAVPSFFRDLSHATRPGGDSEAAARLHRDAVDPSARAGSQYRAISTTTGFANITGPPNFIVDAVATGVQSESVLTSLLTPWPLPEHGIHVSTPQVTTPSGAGSVAENAAVSSTDPVTALIDTPKATIAGRLTASQQLIDLGGMAFDQMIAQELGASNAGEFERQIAIGSGTNELTGLFNTASILTPTYTSATPTVPGWLASFGTLLSNMAQNRKRLPDAIVVSARRWAWMVASLDSQNQPIFASTLPPLRSNGSTSGLVGSIGGIATYASAGIPSNLGAGTNEDRPLVLYTPDLWLLAGPLHFQFTDAQGITTSLAQQILLYRYAALIVRHPQGIGTLTGTGSILPAGF